MAARAFTLVLPGPWGTFALCCFTAFPLTAERNARMRSDSPTCTTTIDKPAKATGRMPVWRRMIGARIWWMRTRARAAVLAGILVECGRVGSSAPRQRWFWLLVAGAMGLTAFASSAPFDNVREQLEQRVRDAHPFATSISVEPARATALAELPDCSQPWLLDLQGQRLLGPVAIRATCPNSGRALRLTVFVRVMVPALVAATALPSGSVLSASNLRNEAVFAAQGTAPVSEPARFIGQRLRTAVRAGQALHPAMLEEPLWVTTGDEVSLTANDDAVSVTVAAKALEDGHEGEQIRVRNLSSGRTVAAWVTGRGRTSTRVPAALPGATAGPSRP